MSLKDFKKFKKQSNETFKKQAEEFNNEEAKGAFKDDPRFFNITQDDTGEGKATLRFLPAKPNTTPNYISIKKHKYEDKKTSRFLNVICPKTFDRKAKCPICEHKNNVWQEGQNNPARPFIPSTLYYANVLVVEEKANPEQEGEVKILRFGKQVFQHIEECLKEEIDYIDFDDGRNFIMKINKDEKNRNSYTMSRFSDAATAIADGEEDEQYAIFEAIHDLSEFYDEGMVLSYEELEEKLAFFIRGGSGATAEDKVKEKLEKAGKKSTPAPEPEEEESFPEQEESSSDDDDDSIDFDSLLDDDDD